MRSGKYSAVMTKTVLTILAFTAALASQVQPDFSGTWTFDRDKTMQPDAEGRIVLAAMLGDDFVAMQTKSSLTFRISVQGDTVVAVYDLTGKETENTSPGDIKVRSRARWEGAKLVIESTSESSDTGRQVRIHTTRVIWVDASGDLIIERSGTPVTQVTPSRSVYRRAR